MLFRLRELQRRRDARASTGQITGRLIRKAREQANEPEQGFKKQLKAVFRWHSLDSRCPDKLVSNSSGSGNF